MDWWQVVSIVFGSGLLSGVVTTLLTQLHQRRENRFDPRREAYAELLTAMDAFEEQAERTRAHPGSNAAYLLDELTAMLDQWSHPLDRPIVQVQLLAPNRTVEAAMNALDRYNDFFLGTTDSESLHASRRELVALMRKDLGSVS